MKYIIDVPDNTTWIQVSTDRLIPYTEPDRKAVDLQYAHDIENVARMNYNEGAKDAWEFARGLLNYTDDDWETITNMLLLDIPYQEAKEKYEAWKKQKDEIRVGDEVEYECDGIVRFVVTGFCGETAFGFKHQCDYDDVGEYCDIEDLRKTGRHFDEVEELLKKMKGA